MMGRVVYCTVCQHVYHIGGDAREIKSLLALLGETYPCITPLCNGRLMTQRASQIIPKVYVSEEIPIKSFYRAVHGFGKAKGAPASLERARELLTTTRIVQVIGESAGQPERMILRELILEDGTRMHFDTSSLGACLYYIEEPGPSCLEVIENELGTATAESSDTDREEVGRAVEALLEGIGDKARELTYPASAPEQPSPGSLSSLSKADCIQGSRDA